MLIVKNGTNTKVYVKSGSPFPNPFHAPHPPEMLTLHHWVCILPDLSLSSRMIAKFLRTSFWEQTVGYLNQAGDSAMMLKPCNAMTNPEMPITSPCLVGFLGKACAKSGHPMGDAKLLYSDGDRNSHLPMQKAGCSWACLPLGSRKQRTPHHTRLARVILPISTHVQSMP